MKLSVIILSFFSITFSSTYSDDSLVVRRILDSCDCQGNVANVSDSMNGRITELNFGVICSKGRVIPEIGQLTELRDFRWTAGSMIHFSLPSEFANLTKLESIDLQTVSLDSIPSNWSAFTNLRSFSFSYTPYSSLIEDISTITTLTNLRTLRIRNASIYNIPNTIDDLSSLVTLDLTDNLISYLPNSLCKLATLETLSVGTTADPSFNCRGLNPCVHMNVVDSINSEFGNLGKLRYLNLHLNNLAELPLSFSNLCSLKTIDLSNNKLADLPSDIITLKPTDLDLSANRLCINHPAIINWLNIFDPDWVGTQSNDCSGIMIPPNALIKPSFKSSPSSAAIFDIYGRNQTRSTTIRNGIYLTKVGPHMFRKVVVIH